VPEAITVECGFCHKRFRCPPEVHARTVRCPYCKTIVKVPASSETGREAVGAISDMVAAEKAERERLPLTARHRPVAAPPRGVRSKTLVAAWLVVLGLALVGIGLGFFWAYNRSQEQAVEKKGGRKKADVASSELAPAQVAATAASAEPASARPKLFSPGPGPAASGAPAAGGQGAAADAQEDPVTVKVERLLGGFKDETITYAVGHVKNNGKTLLKAVKISVRITDLDNKDLGEATAVILNLPGGARAPLVAEWSHAEGVIGKRWFPASIEINPTGVPQELPQVEANEVLAVSDPNFASATGKVKFMATTLGALVLPQVQVFAIVLSKEGKIVGAARGVLDAGLAPKKPKELMIPWTQCPNHLVHSAEVWAQAAL